MEFRKFGNTQDRVSALGFGAMRLPAYEHDSARVDVEKSIELLCRAFDLGVNYVDTAYVYRGGQSETVVGKALKQTSKDIMVSSKFPLTLNPKSGDYTRILEEQLKRMDIGAIDYYHFHGIGKEVFDQIIVPQGFLKEAVKAKEQGLIRHISFSFHDEPEAMRYIIDRAEIMETVLCQYNIVDRRNEEMMAYAKSKGLGVAVMGPLAGGKFVVPEELTRQAEGVRLNSTPEVALRFVLNNPHVDMVLSGMKTLEMVEDNCRIAAIGAPFTKAEQALLDKMIEENRVIADCYCTECCYCMPCPAGINIPYVFRLLNYHFVDGLTDYAKERFDQFNGQNGEKVMLLSSNVPIGPHPSQCTACGLCEGRCPQKLRIRQKLKDSIRILSKENKINGK